MRFTFFGATKNQSDLIPEIKSQPSGINHCFQFAVLDFADSEYDSKTVCQILIGQMLILEKEIYEA